MSRILRRLKIVTLLVFCLAALSACKAPDREESLSRVEREVKQALAEIGKKVDDYAPAAKEVKKSTTAEIEKLFVFEYKVFDLGDDTSLSKIEEQLQKLGEERWECFHIERFETRLSAFCKRRPKTYLRYIPRFLM